MELQSKEKLFEEACYEHGRLTKEFDDRYELNKTLIEFSKKAFDSGSNNPQVYIADEIHKYTSQPSSHKELIELRKTVNRFSKLLEELRNRDTSRTLPPKQARDEKLFQEYQTKHKYREFAMEAIKGAYCVQSKKPLEFIAAMIENQPDYKILIRRETEDLEKRVKIYTNVIKALIKENPMKLKEIEEFSTKTVREENGH